MLRRPQYLALTAAVLLGLVVLNLPEPGSARLKLAFSSLFLPFFGFAGSIQAATDRAAATLTPRKTLIAEIEHLRKENQQLKLDLGETEQVRIENAQLRQQLQWRGRQPASHRLARVVGRDPASWWHTVQIDLGSRDGCRTNLAVLSPEGLVGRVSEVHLDRSIVVLVGDRACQVAAVVDETRDQGVIVPGASGLDPSIVHLTYLPNSGQIKPGQTVTTTGLGGLFPRGLRIGQVLDTHNVGHGLFTEARVKLSVDYSRLEFVWVHLP